MCLSNSVNEVSVFIRESSQDDDGMNDVSIVITQDDNSMMRRAHTMMISWRCASVSVDNDLTSQVAVIYDPPNEDLGKAEQTVR